MKRKIHPEIDMHIYIYIDIEMFTYSVSHKFKIYIIVLSTSGDDTSLKNMCGINPKS